VNGSSAVTSPTAKTRAAVVRRRASTTTAPRASTSTPAAIEADRARPGPSPRGDQDLVEVERVAAPRTLDEQPAAAHLDRLGRQAHIDALVGEPLRDQLPGGGLLLGQQAVGHLDQGDVGAEAGERLPQLTPDRPAAEHDQPRRQLAQRPHRLRGEHVVALESADGRR
jgi:hypothetical protein